MRGFMEREKVVSKRALYNKKVPQLLFISRWKKRELHRGRN
jgi:hypothetical protein